MRNPNVVTINKFINALNDRDLKECLELVDPEVEWHWMDYGPMAGVHSGADGMKTIIEQFETQAWEMFRVEPGQIEAVGSRVLVLGEMRPPVSRREVVRRLPFAWLITVVRGEIVRVLSYENEGKARQALERHKASPRRLKGRSAE